MSEKNKIFDSDDYEESKKIIQTILDFSWNKYNNQNDYYDSLDQKATTLAGFIGIVLTLLTALSNSVFSMTIYLDNKLQIEVLILKLILLLIFVLLILAFLFAIFSLRVKLLSNPSNINEIIKYNKKLKSIDNLKKRHKQLLVGIIKTLSRSEISIHNCNLKKSKAIKTVTALLIFAVIFGFIEILIYFHYLYQLSI